MRARGHQRQEPAQYNLNFCEANLQRLLREMAHNFIVSMI